MVNKTLQTQTFFLKLSETQISENHNTTKYFGLSCQTGETDMKMHLQNNCQLSGRLGNLFCKALWVKFSADDILKYFFYFFLRKQDMILHSNCLRWWELYEMLDPVFWENKNNITNLLSAENFTQSAKHWSVVRTVSLRLDNFKNILFILFLISVWCPDIIKPAACVTDQTNISMVNVLKFCTLSFSQN